MALNAEKYRNKCIQIFPRSKINIKSLKMQIIQLDLHYVAIDYI